MYREDQLDYSGRCSWNPGAGAGAWAQARRHRRRKRTREVARSRTSRSPPASWSGVSPAFRTPAFRAPAFSHSALPCVRLLNGWERKHGPTRA